MTSRIPNKMAAQIHSGFVTIDFGSAEDFNSAVSVTGQTWMTATSVITASPSGRATKDHDADDYESEFLIAQIANVLPGIGFDVVGIAPNGTWGTYIFNWTGRP